MRRCFCAISGDERWLVNCFLHLKMIILKMLSSQLCYSDLKFLVGYLKYLMKLTEESFQQQAFLLLPKKFGTKKNRENLLRLSGSPKAT